MPFRKPMRAPVPPPPGRGRGFSVRALFALCAAAVVFFAGPAERAMAQTDPDTTPVNIPDANLRPKLEAYLGKAAGATITRAEMATLTDIIRFEHARWSTHLVPTPPAPATVIRDLTGVEYMTTATGITLQYNRITDLSPLAGLTNLRRIWARDNLITDLSPLAGLTLNHLQISGNPVSSLSPLAGQVWLATFYAEDTGITDLSPLAGLTRLRILDLQDNYISDISPLTRVNDLTEVFLSGNLISDLSPLANRNLRTLIAANNQITDLSPLRSSLAMETLDLNGNEGLVDLSVVEGMTALKVLRLDGTGVEDLSPLVRNAGLGSGDQVYLRSVPNLNADAEQHIATLRGRGVQVRTSNPLRRDRRVQGVSVTPGVEELTVAWNPLTPTATYNPSGYRVYWWSAGARRTSGIPGDYRTSRAGQYNVDGLNTASYTIPNLTPGVEYKVRILPGTPWGDFSAIVGGTPLAPPPPPPPPLPRVDGVTVTPAVESLVVSWNPVADANGYKVQWKSGRWGYDPATRQARIGDAGTTSHTIPDLTPGVEYTVRVIATRVNAPNAKPSDEATGIPVATPPAPVDDVTVTPGVESLVVSWDPVAGASGYKVQWRSGEQDYDPAARQARTGGAGTTSHTIPDLVPGVEYTVRVIATRANASDGEPSAEATGIPLATPPARVDGVTVTPGVESLVVSWDPVADASGYKVQWRSGEQDYDPAARQARADGMGTTSHTIPGLVPDVEYTVRVIATKDNAPDGEPSEEVTGVPGRRVGVSVADAAAMEGAVVELPVRLTEPSVAVVTLTWITDAGGTAQAGADYRAVATGSLTLQPGDAGGTLRVRTLDDERVEPAETFRVRLTEATNAAIDPEAESATGTISDDDTEPARGRALGMVLAGTGRAIAADAVDVVGERFTRQPAEAQVAVGGLALTGAAFATWEPDSIPDSAAPWGSAGQDGIGGAWATTEADGWTSWTPGEGFQRASALEWLSRSSFDLPLSRRDADGAAGGVDWRLWGRGTAGGFEGTPDAGFRMDGEVLSGYVGLDVRADRDTVLGMAIVHTRVDADYEAEAVTAGAVDLDMTSVLPYAHWKLRPDLGVWGLLGVGRGEVELEDEAGKVETDVEMLTAAFGLRQEVATWRGIDVAVEADTFLAELEAEAARGLPATEGDARRLRLRLEGRKEWELSAVSRIESSLDVGGRWDGGDAETGLGVEVGGGLTYAHTTMGLEVDARGRYLLAHRKAGFDEWGGSVTVRFDPGQARRGPWLTFAPGWGAQGSRMAQMWDGAEVLRPSRSVGGAPGLSPDRLDLDMGYGLVPGGAELLTPYAGLSMAGPQARGYKVGTRLEVDERLGLGVEGRRSVWADGNAGDEVIFYVRARW